MAGAGPLEIALPPDALVVVVAPSGAGKTTFVRRHFQDTEIVSSDRCRALVSDDESNQRATRPAYEVFDAIVRGRLLMGRLTVADATNLEPIPRQRLLDLAREHGRPTVAIVLDVPMHLSRAQNLSRERVVPPHVLEMQYERFRGALAVLPGEGYRSIYRVAPEVEVRVTRASP